MSILYNRINILVVDDEPQMRPLFQLRFRRNIDADELHFLYALSAQEALMMLEQNPSIDIVLCDINMPGMTGLALLPKILEHNDLVRVVMVSAYGDMENIRKAMNLGAYDFVTKPIDFDDLRLTIRKTLREVEIGKRARITRELEEKNSNLRELDRLKSRFFTNISHEFRTPLTLILGMADQVRRDPGHWLEKGIPVIEQNGHRLLNLVNQVLDLQKLESGKLELQLVQHDVIAYLQYLLESFHPLLERKNIRLTVKSPVPAFVMDYDPEKLASILTNLLSNAVKYTPRDGSVEVLIEPRETWLQIKVADSGIGIPEQALPMIFDRFFRASSRAVEGGSGVGLALTKELVELLQGQISVESQEGIGTTFTVLLPVKREAPTMGRLPGELPQTSSAGEPVVSLPSDMAPFLPDEPVLSSEPPSLLIVEDNLDVAQYLSACLEGDYLIHIAWNGQEGIDYAIEHVPDIIISDVMMPEKDGFELCNTLKNDQRTSHIPIILLTAKTDVESRIHGLEKGADAYLAKPFNRRELLVRMEKLLDIRRKLQEYYSTPGNLPVAGAPAKSLEDAFLSSIRQAIEDNLDDEQFGIYELCRAVGSSRTQLHRKIKALTNTSTSIFVRSIRLHKARELLQNTDLNVTQVAFEVGFNDPKYFSTKFQELFGQRPSDFRKQG